MTSDLLSNNLKRWLLGSGAIQVSGLLATTVVGILLARGLGVEGYGRFGIALAVVTLLCVPGELGLAKLVMREVGGASVRGDEPILKGALSWATRTALVTSAAIVAVAGTVMLFRRGGGWSETDLTIVIGLPLIPLTVLTAIWTGAVMGLNNVLRGQMPLQLIRPLLFALFLAALFLFDLSADAPMAMLLNGAATAVALVMAGIWLSRLLPKAPGAARREDGRAWLASSFSLAAIDALATLQGQIGVLFLGLLATSTDAGIFRVAASAALIISLPIQLIETISSPQFARSFGAGDRQGMQHLASRSVQIGFLAFIAAAIVAIAFGKPLIELLFGAEYLPAYSPFLILCLARGTNAIFGMNAGLLMMTGRERQLAGAVALAVTANLILAGLLTPVLGPSGPAIGGLGYFVVWNLLAWREARRSVHVGTALWDSLRPLGRR